MIDNAIDAALLRAVLQDALARRHLPSAVGHTTLLGALSSVLPLSPCKSAVKEQGEPLAAPSGSVSAGKPALEKRDLKIGFVPITCATPIITAKPLGFYAKYGLNVEVVKTADFCPRLPWTRRVSVPGSARPGSTHRVRRDRHPGPERRREGDKAGISQRLHCAMRHRPWMFEVNRPHALR